MSWPGVVVIPCGRAQGQGECVYPNHDRYEGEWEHGVRAVYGTLFYAEGGYYKGDVSSDVPGVAALVCPCSPVVVVVATPVGVRLCNQFANDLLEGYGTRVYSTEVRFTGTFTEGFPNRRGVYFYPEDNATYNGKVRRRLVAATLPVSCTVAESEVYRSEMVYRECNRCCYQDRRQCVFTCAFLWTCMTGGDGCAHRPWRDDLW